MKTLKSLTYALFGMTTLAATLTSCQDEDFGYTYEEIRESVYDRNFLKKYGDLCTPDQKWDFTAYSQLQKNRENEELTRATPSRNETIPGGASGTGKGSDYETDISSSHAANTNPDEKLKVTIPKTYEVPSDINGWMNTNLVEEANNKDKYNQKFTLIGTECTCFYLIPLYQGKAGMKWDLHMVMEEPGTDGQKYDIKVWERSEGFKVDKDGKTNASLSDFGNELYKQNTIGASKIVTNVYKIDGITKGSTITFYLHITKGQVGDTYRSAQTGREFWSDSRTQPNWTSSNMVVLPCNFTTNMETYENTGSTKNDIMIFGVEDAFKGKGSNVDQMFPNIDYTGDNDVNDAVFLLVGGPKLPGIVDENHLKKRYLVEDLGSLVDWDFNDVVIDMEQDIDYMNRKTQRAYLRHRCGTTPFDVFLKKDNGDLEPLRFQELSAEDIIDGHVKGEVQDRDHVEYFRADIPNNIWDPDANNIVVKVYPDERYRNNYNSDAITSDDNNGKYVYTVSMPDKGTSKTGNYIIPKILCVDTDTWWTKENDEFLVEYLNKTQNVEKPEDVDIPTTDPTTPDIKTYPYLDDNGTDMVIMDETKMSDGYSLIWVPANIFNDALRQGYTTLHVEFGTGTTETKFCTFLFDPNKAGFEGGKILANSSATGIWAPYQFTIPNDKHFTRDLSADQTLKNNVDQDNTADSNRRTISMSDILSEQLALGFNVTDNTKKIEITKIYLTKPDGGNTGGNEDIMLDLSSGVGTFSPTTTIYENGILSVNFGGEIYKGFGWSFDPYKDLSSYSKVVIEFTEGASTDYQLHIRRNGNTDSNVASGSLSGNTLTFNLPDTKTDVDRIYLQNKKNTNMTCKIKSFKIVK